MMGLTSADHVFGTASQAPGLPFSLSLLQETRIKIIRLMPEIQSAFIIIVD
jgi:hypothetical protein